MEDNDEKKKARTNKKAETKIVVRAPTPVEEQLKRSGEGGTSRATARRWERRREGCVWRWHSTPS